MAVGLSFFVLLCYTKTMYNRTEIWGYIKIIKEKEKDTNGKQIYPE